MTSPVPRSRSRLFPALLTAAGVTLLAAGLLSYGAPVLAEPGATASPSPTAAALATPSPLITLPPLTTAPPTGTPPPTPSPDPDRVATRVRIAAMGIDLPVIRGPSGYPPCGVAMYLKELAQPGQGKAIYIYAHARTGMFLPLLDTKAPQQRGAVVEVWTSDEQRFLYEIVEVRRNQTDLDDALGADSEELWLQTSEGPKGTPGKTQVIARPLSSGPADDPADAHPDANPVAC
jgi:hypothetical protein